MKVETVLKVLYARYRREPVSYCKDVLSRNLSRYAPGLKGPKPRATPAVCWRLLQRAWNWVENTDSNRVLNDIFWARRAKEYVPDFRIPDWKTALRFAFETPPRQCLELNNGRLPFGCHAWAKYDREFWTPHLLPEASASHSAPAPVRCAS
jgi:hypothetical protein